MATITDPPGPVASFADWVAPSVNVGVHEPPVLSLTKMPLSLTAVYNWLDRVGSDASEVTGALPPGVMFVKVAPPSLLRKSPPLASLAAARIVLPSAATAMMLLPFRLTPDVVEPAMTPQFIPPSRLNKIPGRGATAPMEPLDVVAIAAYSFWRLGSVGSKGKAPPDSEPCLSVKGVHVLPPSWVDQTPPFVAPM